MHVTRFVPIGKNEPGGGTLSMFKPAQLVASGAVKWTTAPHCPGSAQTTRWVGHLIAQAALPMLQSTACAEPGQSLAQPATRIVFPSVQTLDASDSRKWEPSASWRST